MKKSSLVKFAVATAAMLTAALSVSAQNIWLVEPGTLVVTPGYTSQSYDTFYAGDAKMALPADIKQHTSLLRFDYGISPVWAFDATIGYTSVKFSPPGASFKRNGRDDAQLGLTYLLLKESNEAPAITFRFGAILAGSYEVPTTLPPINPGDGASGFEASFAAGKSLGAGFALYGELGYRNRNHGVPDDIFGSAGLAKSFGPLSVTIGYRRTQGQSGGDIGGPGFGTDFGFPGVKEKTQFFESGVSFTDKGGRSYQLSIAKSFGSVRNTGRSTVIGFSVSLPLKF